MKFMKQALKIQINVMWKSIGELKQFDLKNITKTHSF